MLLDICRNRDGACNDDFELSWNVGQKIFMFLKNLTNILAIYITLEEINGGDDSSKKPVGKSCQEIIMLVQTKADAPQLYRPCWQNSDNCYFLGPSKIVTHTLLDNFTKKIMI